MRKHSVRKWVHAVCDLLPLLIIPIFALAVRSDNNYQPISIEYGETKEVTTINYAFDTNSVSSNSDLYEGNIYHTDFEFSDVFDSGVDFSIYIYAGYFEFESEDSIFISSSYNVLSNPLIFRAESDRYFISILNGNEFDLIYYSFSNIDFTFSGDFIDYFDYCGAVYSDFTSSNFNYIASVTQETIGTTVTYNDTDVGSQMVYTLYNTCDKYFNFNQVGTFADIYSWFETNIFGGTAPLSFFIVWNVILYEFIMDLIFLTYMVFMFVIDFTEHLIDGFFDKAYRGGK